MTSTAPAADHNGEHTKAMRQGRQADSVRRRQRVITALERASTDGTEISTSAIARAAGVDRSFLYRHRDLLAQIHTAEAAPPATGHLGRPSPAPRCTPTCSPPANAPPGSPAVSSNWRPACPKH